MNSEVKEDTFKDAIFNNWAKIFNNITAALLSLLSLIFKVKLYTYDFYLLIKLVFIIN